MHWLFSLPPIQLCASEMAFLGIGGNGIGPKRQKRGRVGTRIGHRSVLRVNTARTFANAVANDYLCALNYA